MYRTSIIRLFGEAGRQTKQFIRQELQLAQAEFSEKAAHYRQAATRAGAGAFIAYGAFIVLLTGLGFFLSYLLQNLGLDGMRARSAGFGGIGLLVMIAGALVLWKGLRSLSSRSVAPEKTLYTIKRLTGSSSGSPTQQVEAAAERRTSKQIQAQVLATEQRLGSNLEALVARFSPAHYLRAAGARVRANPVRWNLAALVTGFAGSVWFVKRLRK